MTVAQTITRILGNESSLPIPAKNHHGLIERLLQNLFGS